MGRWRGAVVGLLVGALAALAPAAATATRYHVYACHSPDGLVAPIDGWVGSTSSPYEYALDDCAGQTTRSLTAAMDGQVPQPANASGAEWAFTAAPDLTLAAATLYRHDALPGGADAGASYVTFLAAPNPVYDLADVFDSCQASAGCSSRGTGGGGFDPSNYVLAPASHLAGGGRLFVGVFCGGAPGASCPTASGYAAQADLYAADLTLDDAVAPVASNVGGPLVAGIPLTGSANIWFAAADRGSGVYSARLSVDGHPVTAKVLDDNGGACRTLGEASDGLRDYLNQVPCRTSTHGDLNLDTGTLADGPHALAVTVEDAAGNVSGVYSGTITTRNAPRGGEPQVTGVLAQGQRLVADPGTWSPAATSFAYQWLRCVPTGGGCQPIAGAVGQEYLPVAGDDYQLLAVEVTASDTGGSTTVRSAAVGPIADLSASSTGVGGVTAQSGGLTGAAGRSPGVGHVANGTGGCAAARLTASFGRGQVARVRLGRGAVLHGTLACSGHGVAGAAIEVSIARPGDHGAPTTANVSTAPDGSFTVGLGPGPSRELTLTYRAFADATAASASAWARLEVTPAVSLSIRPARVRNGQTITYSGQVSGGYIPAAGLPLEVQYRDGRRWRTFDQTRARARDGRFAYRYTFRRTTVPIVYTFRVVIPASGVAGYPYVSTASRPRSVRVNP
jgi:hypothetical protein